MHKSHLVKLAFPQVTTEIEAVFSKATQIIAWRELQNNSVWRQGWV